MIRVILALLTLVGSVSTITYRERFEDYARLEQYSRFIEVRPAGIAAFVPAQDGAGLEAGDTLRADGQGFGEVRYFEGSLSRLDASTTMVVQELAEARRRVRVHLDVGRTWHRVVRTTGEEDRFEVSTPVAVATVRGTVFAISCTPERVCTFVVFEGVVRVDTIAGQTVELEQGRFVVVGPDGRIGEVASTPDLTGNQWVERNRALDRGEPPQGVLAIAPPGNLSGTWDAEFVVTESVNVFDLAAGDVVRQRWVVRQSCDDGACDFQADVTVLGDDVEGEREFTVDYRYVFGAYVRDSFSPGECVDPASGSLLLRHGYDAARTTVLRAGGPDGTKRPDRLAGADRVASTPTQAGHREECLPARQAADLTITRASARR